MEQDKKIEEARITKMPKKLFDEMPVVQVRLEGDKEFQALFSYYPDELVFWPEEFIGLTLHEGRQLKFQKDLKYLRS